ncbi:hypothetical protein GOP47_0027614 [Adiantum capillus-veneris]|nr:hypothetical protein GOP47_0027614 [Adiantum capillus-veneris]
MPAPEKALFLSAIDAMCREMPHNRRILFYKLRDAGEYVAVVERLKVSLSEALAHFWPLAGRLRRSTSGRLELDCNDAGAEFLEARVEGISFEELQRSDFSDRQPLFMELAPWINPPDYALAPPLCIQISRFDCGSFALGLAHSHVVCDGTSLWHFFTSWAEIARGEKTISLPPVHTRTLLKLDNPSPKKAFLRSEGVDEDTLHGSTEKEDLLFFHFSKEAVKNLKAQVGGERSSYEAMCAHLWKRASLARGHAPDKKVSFIQIVNMRGRAHPPLPEGYFGNALMWTTSVTTAGDLQEENLEATANRIHQGVAACDGVAFRGLLHWLEVHDREEVLARCMLNGARLRASSSTRFPVFEVDFGWGGPVAVRCPCMELPGKIIFFPSPDGVGSIDLTLALPSPIMQRLANDQAFLHP